MRTRTRNRTLTTAAMFTALGVSIAGCAPTPTPEAEGLSIVASTNVWGDIARSIAGDNATVTSFISNSAQDPHSYEASARDQLAMTRADLVIENGGGYDPFIDALVDASPNGSSLIVINASEVSGLMPDAEDDHAEGEADGDDHAADDHAGDDHIEGFNEHVWYSFGAVDAVALTIARELSDLDPDNAAVFETNYEAFSAELSALTARADAIGAEAGVQSVAITEPVPLYLLEAVGLINATPAAFSEAFEEGIDIPPTAMRDTLALFTNRDVVVLAYNDQTTSGQGELVLDAAKTAGVSVVPFAETLPDGQDYSSWMSANLEAVAMALIQ
jgi:zinc/manganese transport system substrate-binding protein